MAFVVECVLNELSEEMEKALRNIVMSLGLYV
jgi:hypothetical protein